MHCDFISLDELAMAEGARSLAVRKLPSKAVCNRAVSKHTKQSLDSWSVRIPVLKANLLARHQGFRSCLPLYLAKNLIYLVYLFLD